MDARTLELLYCIAAQALTPPDNRWLEVWRWRLGNVQLDLWLDNADESLARPLLALMQSLPASDEQCWLPHLAQEYMRLFTPKPVDVSVLPAMQAAARRWGYVFPSQEEPGLARAFALMAHLCRMAGEEPAANAERYVLLTQALCPLILATVHRLRRQATTKFYQAVGEFLPTLVRCDLAGSTSSLHQLNYHCTEGDMRSSERQIATGHARF